MDVSEVPVSDGNMDILSDDLAPAAPATTKGPPSGAPSGTVAGGIIVSPRGRRSSSLMTYQASRVSRPATPRGNKDTEKENARLRSQLKKTQDELNKTKDLAQTRADYILFEQEQSQRLLNNAVSQSHHLASRVRTEHEQLTFTQQSYSDAEAGARHYAQMAWEQHQYAERHAEQAMRVGQEALFEEAFDSFHRY